MSYLVLARKWRPKTFQDLTGQAHVISALTGAFERGHLHHAYLLTGTRGIGKTTIARILAKSFNCETGITATPCGICSACTQIDSGRFPDMLEIDAASHTGVDNVREILDNAHYMPTMGRHKVYLIDEVHMLSKAAFNAMLKTLEEPPLHIKFILATTDPQKIPPTVLSRCLQFHLRPLQHTQIETRFEYILDQENIKFEPASLTLLAHAAQGSLRDGLSLLDQAIAYGGGHIQEHSVRDMLGIVNQNLIFDILSALGLNDSQCIYTLLQQLANETQDFESVLNELAQQLHRIALIQQAPEALKHYPKEAEPLKSLAERLSPETVQLFYQITLHGKRDISLAPDAFAGLSMTLLRMLTFRPISPYSVAQPSSDITQSHSSPKPIPQKTAPSAGQNASQNSSAHTQNPVPTQKEDGPTISNTSVSSHQQKDHSPVNSSPHASLPQTTHTPSPPSSIATAVKEKDLTSSATTLDWSDAPSLQATLQDSLVTHTTSHSPEDSVNSSAPTPHSNEAWQTLIQTIKVSPMARQLLLQSAWSGFDTSTFQLTLTLTAQHKHLSTFQKELTTALQTACDPKLSTTILIQDETENSTEILDTPAQRIKTAEREETQARIQAFSDDPFVQMVCEATGAQVDEHSVRATTNTPPSPHFSNTPS